MIKMDVFMFENGLPNPLEHSLTYETFGTYVFHKSPSYFGARQISK